MGNSHAPKDEKVAVSRNVIHIKILIVNVFLDVGIVCFHAGEKIRPWARGLCVIRLKTIGRGRGGHPWWAQPLFVMIK